METVNHTNMLHIGRKIERIRRLRGLSQTELGEALGVTKQAISKMEQTEQLDDEKVRQVAEALGVTEEGLKSFHEERVLYNTINFYDNSGVNASSISSNNIENLNNFPIEQTIKLFETLLEKERQKFDKVKKAVKK